MDVVFEDGEDTQTQTDARACRRTMTGPATELGQRRPWWPMGPKSILQTRANRTIKADAVTQSNSVKLVRGRTHAIIAIYQANTYDGNVPD